jgi:hypothetical protein
LSTSTPHHEFVCNTTPVRIYAVVGQFDLLVGAVGGVVHTPREVLDPEEDPDLAEALLSELGRSERYFAKRSDDPDALERRYRLQALRSRDDIAIIDLDARESQEKRVLTSRAVAREHGLAGRLGDGEAAAMAIAATRGWTAVIDDGAARRVIAARTPDVPVVTSRELLVRAVTELGLCTSGEAQLIYQDMLAANYRGPDDLFSGQ